MAAVDVGARNVPPVPAADDLDDLFNYDVGDAFRDVDTNIDVSAPQEPASRARGKENVADLGIDEEIKVIKKRAPVPKLDENRLLGPAGIPKLRRITKDHLRFKGKGHEYSGVTRLLNVYQLWLDELYPRAKFADGLAMIEKLGHSKRMQTMRREWINEGKPKDRMAGNETAPKKLAIRPPDSQASKDQMTVANPGMGLQELSVFGDNDNESHEVTPKPHDVEESINDRTHPAESLFVSDGEDLDDQPPEDDLDALLAEDQTKLASSPKTVLPIADAPRREDDFGDEMEAMAGMEDMW